MKDHCTLWPDRIGSIDWGLCCFHHDISYAIGSNKWAADWALFQCVVDAGSLFFASLMLVGVSIAGGLFHNGNKKK
ncbi:MAG: hypothetical protein COA78_33395 [Blastopirellula sp.]|nr:MAG: hypothetical protein COA78_33395 [Blastopirellula sp.]